MSFFFGQTPSLTPQGTQRKRELADAFLASMNSPRNLGEGLSSLGSALAVRGLNKQADKAERTGKERASQTFSDLLSGGSPTRYSSKTGPMTINGIPPRSEEQEIGDDAMAALGKDGAMSIEGRVVKGLTDRGLPGHVADAFVWNFRDESGLNPGINEQNPIVPGSRGGFGLAQWTGPRRKQLEAFAAERGTDVTDLDTQLDFLMTELQGSESAAGRTILSTRNTPDAAAAIVNDFLRPAEEHRARREAQYRGGSASRTTQQSPDNSRLYAALADPWLDQTQKSVILNMIQQNQQANDPLRQIQLQTAQAELDRLQNPGAVSPDKQYKVLDGRLVDMLAEGGPQAVDLGEGGAPQANFDDESKLRKEFIGMPATKAFSEQAQAFGRIEASAKDPSPAGDLALIFNYMKVLDPGSVVRESEFATAEQAAAWLQEMGDTGYNVPLPVARAIRKAQTGERLSDEQRTDFVGRASQLYLSAEGQADDRHNDWRIRAEEYGMSPERTLPDFRYTPRGATPFSLRPQGRPGTEPASAGQANTDTTWNGPNADEIRGMDPQSLAAMLSAYDIKDIPDDVLQAIEERM